LPFYPLLQFPGRPQLPAIVFPLVFDDPVYSIPHEHTDIPNGYDDKSGSGSSYPHIPYSEIRSVWTPRHIVGPWRQKCIAGDQKKQSKLDRQD